LLNYEATQNIFLMPLSFLWICFCGQNKDAHKKAQEKEESVTAEIVKHGSRRSVRRKAPAIDVQATGDIEGSGRKENHEKRICHKDRTAEPEIQDQEKPQQQLEPWKNDGGDMDHSVREDTIVVNDFRKGLRVKDLVDARVEKNKAKKNARHDDRYDLKA
jgi:hypothetical protein